MNNYNETLELIDIGMPWQRFPSWVYYYLTHMTLDGEAKAMTTITIKNKEEEKRHESDKVDGNDSENVKALRLEQRKMIRSAVQ